MTALLEYVDLVCEKLSYIFQLDYCTTNQDLQNVGGAVSHILVTLAAKIFIIICAKFLKMHSEIFFIFVLTFSAV